MDGECKGKKLNKNWREEANKEKLYLSLWRHLQKKVMVLLSASVKRFGVSRMQDFYQCLCEVSGININNIYNLLKISLEVVVIV